MKLNKEWHLTHKMPRNASFEERLNWHMLHAENCQCREMPESIRRELEARGWTAPSVRSLK
jgi:hypothetical protein